MYINKVNEYLSQTDLPPVPKWILDEYEYLVKYSYERQHGGKSERPMGKLYMSQCGDCPRKLAYQLHKCPKNGKTITTRDRSNFHIGDVLEAKMICNGLLVFGKERLKYVGKNQKTTTIEVNGEIITGHPDGQLDDYLLECKTMNPYAHDRLVRTSEVDYGYLTQVNMYMEAEKLNKCILVAFNKGNSMEHEITIDKQQQIVDDVYKNLETVLKSTPDNLPDRRYTFDKKGLLPWNCTYCSYYKTCWEDKIERVLVGKSYKLKRK